MKNTTIHSLFISSISRSPFLSLPKSTYKNIFNLNHIKYSKSLSSFISSFTDSHSLSFSSSQFKKVLDSAIYLNSEKDTVYFEKSFRESAAFKDIDCVLSFFRCSFVNCFSYKNGGALTLLCNKQGMIQVTNCYATNCTAYQQGGAFYFSGYHTSLRDLCISYCQCGTYGHSIVLVSDPDGNNLVNQSYFYECPYHQTSKSLSNLELSTGHSHIDSVNISCSFTLGGSSAITLLYTPASSIQRTDVCNNTGGYVTFLGQSTASINFQYCNYYNNNCFSNFILVMKNANAVFENVVFYSNTALQIGCVSGISSSVSFINCATDLADFVVSGSSPTIVNNQRDLDDYQSNDIKLRYHGECTIFKDPTPDMTPIPPPLATPTASPTQLPMPTPLYSLNQGSAMTPMPTATLIPTPSSTQKPIRKTKDDEDLKDETIRKPLIEESEDEDEEAPKKKSSNEEEKPAKKLSNEDEEESEDEDEEELEKEMLIKKSSIEIKWDDEEEDDDDDESEKKKSLKDDGENEQSIKNLPMDHDDEEIGNEEPKKKLSMDVIESFRKDDSDEDDDDDEWKPRKRYVQKDDDSEEDDDDELKKKQSQNDDEA